MKHIKLWRIIGLLLALMIVTLGCTSSPNVPENKPDFTGLITAVNPNRENGTLVQILVEPLNTESVNKYIVTIDISKIIKDYVIQI